MNEKSMVGGGGINGKYMIASLQLMVYVGLVISITSINILYKYKVVNSMDYVGFSWNQVIRELLQWQQLQALFPAFDKLPLPLPNKTIVTLK